MVFFGFVFFEVHVILVSFWCVWPSSKSVKNACFFSQFFGLFCGVASSCLFGFGRFRCFVFLLFVFLFCVAFVSVLFALFFCFVVGLCWVLVLVLFFFFVFLFVFFVFFCSFFVCFVFCFLGVLLSFKGLVRWPKGPPHLALNPPFCC